MIDRKRENCFAGTECARHNRCRDCRMWSPSRAALEAEVERLGVALGIETNRCGLLVDKAADERALSQKLHDEAIAEKLLWRDRMDDAIDERDAAIASVAEERAARTGLEGQLAEAERRRDELRAQVAARDEEIAALRARVADWAAQYRALSARPESELGGLRHSLDEVEREREEARAKVAGLASDLVAEVV